MPYITRNQLLRYAGDQLLLREARSHRAVSAQAGIPVFLSHSHHDTELVEAAKSLLANQGAMVYIDWQDGGLPANTSRETAETLKRRIAACRKLVLLASQNALSSVWVPWELGCADGEKGVQHIAVLPVADNSGAYVGNEYLRIYPKIEPSATGMFTVVDPGQQPGTGTPLPTWLAR